MPQGPDASCLEPVRGLGAEKGERGPWGAEEGGEHSPGYGWGVHRNGAGGGDADYCLGSVYLLLMFLFSSLLYRGRVVGGRGLGDRQTWPGEASWLLHSNTENQGLS